MLRRVFLMAVVCLPFAGSGQNIFSVHACEILGSYTGYGYAGAVGYVNHVSNRVQLRLDFFYSREQHTTIETLHHQVYGADFYVSYTVKYFRSLEVYVNLLAGVTVSKEQGYFTNLPVEYKALKLGGMGGIEAEKYLSVNCSLVASFNQRYLLNPNDQWLPSRYNQWGSLRWYAGLGVRFHIAGSNREE